MATPHDSKFVPGTTDEDREDNSSLRLTGTVDAGSKHGTSDEYFDPWCDPCENEGSYVRVVSYCPKCVEFFCKPCDRSHAKFQITKSHVVQRGSDMPSCQANKPPKYEECRIHDGKLREYMCTIHKIMICEVCQKDHENCNVKHATEMCKLIESSHVDELVHKVESLCNDAVRMKESVEGNTANIGRQKKDMLREAQAKYDELVSKCTQQLKEAKDSIEKKCKANTSVLSQHLKDLSVATMQLDSIRQQVQAVDKSKVDTKSFLKLQTLAENTKRQMTALNELTRSFKYIETGFKWDEKWTSFLSKSVRMGTVQESVTNSKHVVPMQDIAFPCAMADAVSFPKGSDTTEPDFPVLALARLDEMINRERWVVPVLPMGELEVLLDAAIQLCIEGRDTNSEPCQRFFREGLRISFTKLFTTADAVSGWKSEIHNCIYKCAEKLVELCVLKLSQDCFQLLDLLALVFCPECKFHTCNIARPSELAYKGNARRVGIELFAAPPDPKNPKGWLVDLVIKFGQLGGFQILLDRFTYGPLPTVPVIAALVKPFGQCAEVLDQETIRKYLIPIVDIALQVLVHLSDEELKKSAEAKEIIEAIKSIRKPLIVNMARRDKISQTIERLERKMKLK